MTLASLLLALLAVTSTPSDATADSGAVLLDFHAEWCGPCKQMRPAVAQLVRKGYPVKSVDVDQSPRLASRYRIEAVPTFIVVDSAGEELDRTTGPRPAADLARFFNVAAAKARPPANSRAHAGSHRDSQPESGDEGESDGDGSDPDRRSRAARDDDGPEHDAESATPAFKNPKPWQTVVRIRVLSKHSTGFGSGTVIHSSPEESLVLTCAHIFKIEARRQAPPDQFPRRIMIDLFDGNLQGTDPAMVHFVEAIEGKAVDYDFTRDVGLIRIRPGRRLPASRVVPAHWQPKARMKVLTLGCSEGQEATAWHTIIDRPRINNFLSGNPTYEAIECRVAPKQGRSGGGLFTTDGYIAGVCNFAEPQGNHGLYATPRSIYYLLDRNNLMALYAPASRGSNTLLAEGTRRGQPRLGAPGSVARSQSPDQEEPGPERARVARGDVMIPPPSMVGIAEPIPAQSDRAETGTAELAAAADSARRTNWLPIKKTSAPGRGEHALPTDLNLDPRADQDHFGPQAAEVSARPGGDDESPRPVSTSAPTSAGVMSSKNQWRPRKVSEPAANATDPRD